MPGDVLVKNNLVRWVTGHAERFGVVIDVPPGGRSVTVRFDGGDEQIFAYPSTALVRHQFFPGARVELLAERTNGVIAGTGGDAHGIRFYRVEIPGQTSKTVMESGLRPAIVTDPVELLRVGRLHRAWLCNLRTVGTRLLFAHQFDELSSLSNSRVEIKPHQVGVVHRVATTYPHRCLLADEVGLGKTIEAGLILKELKARGVAKRVLVLAPPNLVSQWQFELKTKFNEIFAHYNGASIRYLQSTNPGENVWTLNPNVITSTSYASYDEQRIREIVLAGWDMVILDEAHHARRTHQGGNRYESTLLYRLMEAIMESDAGRSASALFLTATPMQLDPFELYSLIELLDPTLFANYLDFEEHRSQLAGLNATADALRRWSELDKSRRTNALAATASWLAIAAEEGPLGDLVAQAVDPEGRIELIEALASKHRLSQAMIRNRKAVVGGFMPRVAFIWPVELTEQERIAYDEASEYAEKGYASASRSGNTILRFLMTTFRRLNSSSSYALRQSLHRRMEKLEAGYLGGVTKPEADHEELDEMPVYEAFGDWIATQEQRRVRDDIRELRRLIARLDGIAIDSKARVLLHGLAEIADQEAEPKVLIFTQFRDTQEYLRRKIGPPWRVNVFHGQLKPEEKDAEVERFRDGRGPQVLISTEAGGEGRNFQFCHTLINYDLPWNPMKIEQRIGRLDRVGQKHPVKIINFSILGTIDERVLDVLSRRIRVFEETIGGLDPILGDVETDIQRIYLAAGLERDRALERLERGLAERIAKARETERRLADLIMDTRSFRQDEVQRLLERKGAMDNRVLRRFVLSALTELGVKVDKDPEISGVFVIRFGGRFLDLYPQFVKEGKTRRVTFDPAVALDYQTIEFLAFGHELVDELVQRVRQREYHGLASYRRIQTDECPATTGWLFTYTIELQGLLQSKEVFPVFVGEDGSHDSALSRWLLDRASLFKKEEADSHAPPERDDAFDRAVMTAEMVAVMEVTERQQGMSETNRGRLVREKEKLERFYEYRAKAAAEKLASVERTFHAVSTSDDPLVQRIIPVWARNVEIARQTVDDVARERERRLKDLDGRDQVIAQHELLTASYVEIVPEQA